MARLSETGPRRHVETPLGELGAWCQAAEQDLRADALLEWIEDCDCDARLVPDWSDESFRDAA
jgi:hypothetical protein